MHAIYGLSLVFFFLFLRSEYLRNVEQCIWNTVTSMQVRVSLPPHFPPLWPLTSARTTWRSKKTRGLLLLASW